MLSGRQFRLRVETLGLAVNPADGKRYAVHVPAGALLRVISGPRNADDRMVDVVYESQTLTMFVVDVRDRGDEVSAQQG